MGLKDMDIEAGLRRLADRKIEEAVREGKFDNLEGAGKPLDLEPVPVEENARLRWWALRILKQNDVIPDEVRWRKRIDTLKEELAKVTTESAVTALVNGINAIVRQVNTLGTNALIAPVAPVSLERELARLRERAAGPGVVPFAQLARPAAGGGAKAGAAGGGIKTCPNTSCLSRNPQSAQFCRRCGAAMA